jgi:YbbR domain-containing protein
VRWRELLASWNHNLPMKFTALAVAFVFWFLMLGRQDITLSRDLEVQVLLGPQLEIANEIPSTVTVEIVGPRVSLKRFSAKKEVFTMNLSSLSDGYHKVRLNESGVNLPIGLEILGIRPRSVDVVIRKVDGDVEIKDVPPGEGSHNAE